MTRFRQARDRGGAYLVSHQAADGSFPQGKPDIADYYKTITAFEVCGRSDAASRLCHWIRRCAMGPDGDFCPQSDPPPGHLHGYFNAWIVCGAHRAGQFDLSGRGMDFLMRLHDPVSGGFYSSAQAQDDQTVQDIMPTCMCGLAALYTGRIEAATSVGRWLKTVRDRQPAFPQKLYSVYSRAGGLHTDPPAGQERRYVVDRSAKRDQNIFNPGIAAAFLAQLYQATGYRATLELAEQYIEVALGASDFLLGIVRAGKVGWATALLYRITGQSKYRQMARRIGANLIRLQADQGYWSGVGQTTPSFDSTAERVVWMDAIDCIHPDDQVA